MVQSNPPGPARRGRATGRVLAGVALVLAGSLTLSLLVWMSNSGDSAAERLMFDLGLALTSLISAGAQACVFCGVWILWRMARRGR